MTPSDLNRCDEAAAQWALRLSHGPLSAAEERSLADWVESEQGNRARLESYCEVYVQLGQIVPEMVRAGELPDYGARRRTIRVPRRMFRWVAPTLAAAAVLTLAAVWWTQRPKAISTLTAQRQSVVLADGSHVDLNARTSLDVRLHGHDRRIHLEQGEAYFAVAKDPSRPFYVETSAGTVRVTGTAFNVRADTPTRLEVTVLEGSVAVTPSSDHQVRKIVPNDQLIVDGGKTFTRRLDSTSAHNVIAWRDGHIVFESEKLAVAVERFGEYHDRVIQLDPALGSLEVGGRFQLDDLDNFLRGIEVSLPVRVLRGGDGLIRIVPAGR